MAYGASVAAAHDGPFSGKVNLEYERLGCIPRQDDDNDLLGTARDTKCLKMDTKYSPLTPCRGGLPFFRNKVEADAAEGQCFRFCASKGLDLFGVTDSRSECRCGASPGNEAIWGKWEESAAARGLQMRFDAVRKEKPCDGIDVYRYIGWLENPGAAGVPWLLVEPSPEDVAYVNSIVQNSDVQVAPSATVTETDTSVALKGQLWPILPGGGVKVPFSFAGGVDSSLTHVVRRAAKEWSYRTMGCVSFVEADGAGALTGAHVVVDTSDPALCGPGSAVPIRSSTGEGVAMSLHLGGCADPRSLGPVVHALGLAVGIDVKGGGQGGLSSQTIRKLPKELKCPSGIKSLLQGTAREARGNITAA